MYRRICSAVIVVILIANMFAYAEQKEGSGFFGSIGGFISDTVHDAGEAFDSATDNVTDFFNGAGESIGDAFGDAKQSIEKFWNSAGEQIGDAWNWAEVIIKDAGSAINESTLDTINQLNTWLDISGDNALNVLKSIFEEVSSRLGIAGNKATELWESIYQYSVDKNINMVVLVKLTLAIMIRVSLGSDLLIGEMAGDYIDEIVLDWFKDFNINSEEDAEKALSMLENSLENAVSDIDN